MGISDLATTLTTPKPSGWRVHLVNGVEWHPDEGQVPNAFWRLMQRLMFGFRWERL